MMTKFANTTFYIWKCKPLVRTSEILMESHAVRTLVIRQCKYFCVWFYWLENTTIPISVSSIFYHLRVLFSMALYYNALANGLYLGIALRILKPWNTHHASINHSWFFRWHWWLHGITTRRQYDHTCRAAGPRSVQFIGKSHVPEQVSITGCWFEL